MPLEIKITDQQIRPSQEFINFITRMPTGLPNNESWFDQLSEHLKTGGQEKTAAEFEQVAGKKITDETTRQALLRSYQYTIAIILGQLEVLKAVQDQHQFVFVVGCPRSGGSYLTKQLFLALGEDPSATPGLLAHDGFPKAWPFYIGQGHNQHTDMSRYLAEYLVMVERYFRDKKRRDGKIIVPKKDLNAAYHGSFFNNILGGNVEYVITVRHPVSCCISSYEKSGGLPADGRFAVRSTIEHFVQRDNVYTGARADQLPAMAYFDVYLRYWEQYHHQLALSGLCSDRAYRIVPYRQRAMMDAADHYRSRFAGHGPVEAFQVFSRRGRHEDWMEKAGEALERVRGTWKLVGLDFPSDALEEAW